MAIINKNKKRGNFYVPKAGIVLTQDVEFLKAVLEEHINATLFVLDSTLFDTELAEFTGFQNMSLDMLTPDAGLIEDLLLNNDEGALIDKLAVQFEQDEYTRNVFDIIALSRVMKDAANRIAVIYFSPSEEYYDRLIFDSVIKVLYARYGMEVRHLHTEYRSVVMDLIRNKEAVKCNPALIEAMFVNGMIDGTKLIKSFSRDQLVLNPKVIPFIQKVTTLDAETIIKISGIDVVPFEFKEEKK